MYLCFIFIKIKNVSLKKLMLLLVKCVYVYVYYVNWILILKLINLYSEYDIILSKS